MTATCIAYWQIADAYYLYQHSFSSAWRQPAKVSPLDIDYPRPWAGGREFFLWPGAGLLRPGGYSADTRTGAAPGGAEVSSQGCADAGLLPDPDPVLRGVDFTTGSATAIPPQRRARQPIRPPQRPLPGSPRCSTCCWLSAAAPSST